MKKIATLGSHVIYTIADATVEPGHQRIAIAPADHESAALLFALTGNGMALRTMPAYTLLDNGEMAMSAPHDAQADERLMQLVDICADLRFTAPYMLQLGIKFDESA